MIVCFRQCNIEDCPNNDDNYDIYDVTPNAAKKIIELYSTKYNDIFDFHICLDCLDDIIYENPNMFKVEENVVDLY